MKNSYDPPDYPDNPPWTMFFDGPLYEKYKEFMANKDFSKILLTSKLKLANQTSNGADVPDAHVAIDWWSIDHDDAGKENQVASDTYHTVSDTFYKKFTRGKKEEKKRTRRTRAIILLIILVLLAVSLGTALIIHYFFVPKDDDIATAQVNISFSGNTSILGMTTDITSLQKTDAVQSTTEYPTKTTTPKNGDEGHGKEKPDRGGRLFEDTKNVTVTSINQFTKLPNVTNNTIITTTEDKEAETETVDPFDFFSMDDNMTTTTTQPNQTSSTGVSHKTTVILDTSVLNSSTSTNSTNATPTTKKAPETSLNATATTILPSTETSVLTTESETSTSSAENPSLDSTTVYDITDSTTTTLPSTSALEQVTNSSTVPSTTERVTDTTNLISTTTNLTVIRETNRIDETTLAAIDTTALINTTESINTPGHINTTEPSESVTVEAVTSVVQSTKGSTDTNDITTEDSTILDIGTEMFSTTQVFTTSVPKETTIVADSTTTGALTTGSSSTVEFVTQAVGPITTESLTNDTLLEYTTTVNLSQTTDVDILAETTTVEQSTPTTIVEPTTTTEVLPHLVTEDETAYKTETTRIICRVTDLGRFTTLSVKEDKYWSPVEVTLYNDGSTQWSYSRTDRHHVTHDIKNISGSDLKQLTMILEIQNVQCQDAGSFNCILNTPFYNITKTAQLTVVGRPDKKVTLQLGPSIIEDRAFRITAIWQAGYPIPWSNMSWMALDARNQTYNLEDYGEYRDYELREDHTECQTFIESSIVIFPKVHLNDTTVIVKPDLNSIRYFVDDTMMEHLRQVEYGVEKVRVIPLNYCPSVSKEVSIPHPYTDCTKFIWCLPGNLFVQQCPTGTCFYEKWQECL